MILKRNKPVGLICKKGLWSNKLQIQKVVYRNVITGQKVTPQSLTLLMYDLYKQKGFTSERSQLSHFRQAKQLIDLVGGERAVVLMLFAAKVCKYVWTYKFLIVEAKKEIDNDS